MPAATLRGSYSSVLLRASFAVLSRAANTHVCLPSKFGKNYFSELHRRLACSEGSLGGTDWPGITRMSTLSEVRSAGIGI